MENNKRLCVVYFDLGEEANSWLESTFPEIDFFIRKKGEAAPSEELLNKAEIFCGFVENPALLEPLKNVKYIHTISAGVDKVIDYLHPDILFSNGAGTYAVALGEHVIALLMALIRGIGVSAQNMAGAREWKHVKTLGTMKGSRVAVLGTGDIGTHVARCLKGMGANYITGYKLHAAEPFGPFDEIFYGPDGLEPAIRDADYVIVCLPGSPFTAKCINAKTIAAMKKGAILVNIGRGSIVDTDAMMEALSCGQLLAAGMDVTDPEPLPADHPLWDMPNVIITAHYAGWSVTGLERAQWFGENLKAYLKNEPLPGEVDRIWKY